MKVGTTNVREIYFKHQDLTWINVKPTFTALHHMMLQLKSNAVSVPCSLGGGMCRYFGIILSLANYAILAAFTPFIVSAPPGPLNIVNNNTQY